MVAAGYVVAPEGPPSHKDLTPSFLRSGLNEKEIPRGCDERGSQANALGDNEL